MIPVSVFAGQRVALFGLGGSGLVTAQALKAGGADIVAFDDNPTSVDEASKQGITTANLRDEDWSLFAALVLAPGVPLTHPQPHWSVDLAKAAGVEIIGDIELFARQMAASEHKAPFVAITGTNGKSTTTALIAHVLEAAGRDVQMGGNIGRAVLDLDPPGKNAPLQAYVVECSSYQIDTSPSLDPSVGVLLNVTPDHLERHGTIENYASIKERLVANSDLAVVGIDDRYCAAIAGRLTEADKPLVTISGRSDGNAEVGFNGEALVLDTGENPVSLAGIGTLRGRHNGQNAAAAYAACRAVGLADEEIQAGFSTFPGLVHRLEQVGSVGKTLFVNDSKATNADAAATALTSFDRIHWIAGGLAKDGGIEPLVPHFSRIAKAYLIGEAASSFASVLADTIPYEISGTLKDAVNHAALDASRTGEEEVVLLSPAAASFDQFRNFEKRGDAFREAVMALDGFSKFESNSS